MQGTQILAYQMGSLTSHDIRDDNYMYSWAITVAMATNHNVFVHFLFCLKHVCLKKHVIFIPNFRP